MRAARRSMLRLGLAFALPAIVAACAPAPLYKTGPATVVATPGQVATSPGHFVGALVVWGGEVIGIDNLDDRTRIRVLAYPLDSSQRPLVKKAADGRFAAIVPGFLDPMNFPPGSLVTMRGSVAGTWTGSVGEASYVYPKLDVPHADLHRWTPEEMRKGHPNISFGVGVGVGSW